MALLTSPTVAPVPPKTRAQINDELVSAVMANDLDRAKAAIARGADVNAKALGVDMTPLIVAASAGGQPMVEWLLEKGADVNAANKAGQTALILAASGGRTAIVRLLLDKGANPGAKTIGGQTALEMAAHEGRTEVVALLTEKGARLDTKGDMLTEAGVALGLDSETRKALDKNISPEQKARSRQSVLAFIGAVERGDAKLVAMLLDQGADLDGQDSAGDTALIAAAAGDKTAIAQYLVGRAAKVDIANDQGTTSSVCC